MVQPGGENSFRRCFTTRHSSFPSVKPVRTFRLSVCFTIALASSLATQSSAQQTSSRGQSVRQSERVARASWQPTRSRVDSAASQAETPQPRPVQGTSAKRVRAVDHIQVEGVPGSAPRHGRIGFGHRATDSGGTVGRPRSPGWPSSPVEPMYHDYGSVACDALPYGECGCGDAACLGCDAVCDGGCDGVLRRRGLQLLWRAVRRQRVASLRDVVPAAGRLGFVGVSWLVAGWPVFATLGHDQHRSQRTSRAGWRA